MRRDGFHGLAQIAHRAEGVARRLSGLCRAYCSCRRYSEAVGFAALGLPLPARFIAIGPGLVRVEHCGRAAVARRRFGHVAVVRLLLPFPPAATVGARVIVAAYFGAGALPADRVASADRPA